MSHFVTFVKLTAAVAETDVIVLRDSLAYQFEIDLMKLNLCRLSLMATDGVLVHSESSQNLKIKENRTGI